MYFLFYPLRNYLCSLLQTLTIYRFFRGFCLRFSLASDKVAKGILLQRKRPSFKRQKAMYYSLKGRCLKP